MQYRRGAIQTHRGMRDGTRSIGYALDRLRDVAAILRAVVHTRLRARVENGVEDFFGIQLPRRCVLAAVRTSTGTRSKSVQCHSASPPPRAREGWGGGATGEGDVPGIWVPGIRADDLWHGAIRNLVHERAVAARLPLRPHGFNTALHPSAYIVARNFLCAPLAADAVPGRECAIADCPIAKLRRFSGAGRLVCMRRGAVSPAATVLSPRCHLTSPVAATHQACAG